MKHAVGTIVESICGKCNDVMGHTIVAMIGETIAKVECRVCHSVHKFRPPARTGTGDIITTKRGRDGAPTPSRQSSGSKPVRPAASAKRTRKPDPAELAREQWFAMSARRNGEETRPYAMTESFVAGELIMHPTFGLGEVSATVPPDKMDVLFESGVKRLLCNKA